MIRRGRLQLAATAAGLLVLAGCGGASDGTGDLGAGLGRVDDAIVARDYDAARDALDDLGSEAASLADSGDLSTADEKALLSAVDDLRAALPDGAQPPTQDPTETSTPPPATTPPADEGDTVDTPTPDRPDKSDDKGHGKKKDKGKKGD